MATSDRIAPLEGYFASGGVQTFAAAATKSVGGGRRQRRRKMNRSWQRIGGMIFVTRPEMKESQWFSPEKQWQNASQY